MKGAVLVRAGLTTAVVDGLFSSVLSFIYGSTPLRLFQGVAATLLGTGALTGGARTALIGLLMHFTVAFIWSAVFLFVALRFSWVRDLLASRYGVFKVAAVYGPMIWIVMSCVVIPVLTHRPPRNMLRWLIQLFGHVPFVGVPIVASVRKGLRAEGSP